jgi:DNA-binding NtrC family response regulator
MAVVLVVDDIAALAEQYAYDLERIGGLQTRIASGGAEAMAAVAAEEIDCIILDLEMPGVDGFEVLRRLNKQGSTIPVIVYTGTGSYDRCIQAVRLGAHGFIDKEEPMERVALEVENAIERAQLEAEVATLRRDLGDDTPLIGSSGAMKKLKQDIARVAPVPSAVLVTGESGTGKELVARELHRLGPFPRKPFVAINCAALPENLVESELFGHERGAFTGAERQRRGAFERAGNGTLFLDEIGELPAPAQAKLLRVLEEREVTRLGAEKPIAVDARVVAATNRNLDDEVKAKRFREDLYYRLNVHILGTPPLSERPSDIPELVAHFVASTCERFGIRTKTVAPGVTERLMAHDWKRNNVRELRNIVERMIIATDGDTIEPDHVPPGLSGDVPRVPTDGTLQSLRAEAERRIVVAALERNHWHLSNTAKALGLTDHSALSKIMKRHGIKKR